jgi:phosphoenolpyruvate synthase/pyruvate phosphate dikinase
MWSKYITRRLAVQVAEAWNFGWGRAMEKIYGVSVLNTLVFRDAKKTEYYVDEKQHKKYVAGLYELLKNEKFIRNFHKDARSKLESILSETKKKFNQDFLKLSNKELLKIYKDFVLPNVTQFYIRMWTVFNIAEPLADVVMGELKKYVADDKKRIEYLLSLSSPLMPNDVLNERIDLLKLALIKNKMTKNGFLEKMRQHAEKYQHIPLFDFDHEPYAENYFLNEIKHIKNPRKELEEIKRLFANREKEFKKIINGLRPDKKFKNLLRFLKEHVFLRDYRDMIRQKLNLELRRFYQEIGKRLGLNIEQTAILTNDEIIKYLRAGKEFPQKEIRERERTYLLIQKGNKAEIYSGKKALAKARRELKIGKLKMVREIYGTIGSAGKAEGIVKIVYTNKDLHKVKQGDVIVAAMTRQDFVPAVRKAAALVTDEGSVTCHAAIIARELNKPCIVGTKNSTRIFHDGDSVEVDASKGIVRKLK